MNRVKLKASLKKSINWFRRSGIMIPDSAQWGIAERILFVEDPAMREKIRNRFFAYTPSPKFDVLESRRADCNFQGAVLFLEADRIFPNKGYRQMGEELLNFLYFRSGLLNRSRNFIPQSAWHWSHISHDLQRAWIDDNSWCTIIQYCLGSRYPELNEKYQMIDWAEKLTLEIAAVMKRAFMNYTIKPAHWSDPHARWNGFFELPHFSSLGCLALTAADHYSKNGVRYHEIVRQYHEYFGAVIDSLSTESLSFAIFACCAASKVYSDDPFFRRLADELGKHLMAKMDPKTGFVPAEANEAPNGEHLMDLIYGANWSLLALQSLAAIFPDNRQVANQYDKLLSLLVDIQDNTPDPQLNGCWRGLYDMDAHAFGGGEFLEGGAGSIYSGWTNAPIAIGIAFALTNSAISNYSLSKTEA